MVAGSTQPAAADLEIDATSFTAVRTFVAGQAVDALALTSDGGSLFALLHASGRIVKLSAASGRMIATVPGVGYDRLIAVIPW